MIEEVMTSLNENINPRALKKPHQTDRAY